MNRRTVQALVVACLGIIAIAFAAATLTSPVPPDVDWPGNFSEERNTTGADIEEPEIPEDRPIDAVTLERAVDLLPTILPLGLAVAVLYVLSYRRESLPHLLGAAAVVGTLWGMFHAGSWFVASVAIPTIDIPFLTRGRVGGIWDLDPTGFPTLIVIGLGLCLLGLLFAVTGTFNAGLGRRDRSDDSGVAAIGRAAGRAADHLEASYGYESAVHRAWREMTGLLEIPRSETTTPGEFEAVAIEAGMDPDHVRELTRLFEDVRYGGSRPTAARERRAIEIFRRIESSYPAEGR